MRRDSGEAGIVTGPDGDSAMAAELGPAPETRADAGHGPAAEAAADAGGGRSPETWTDAGHGSAAEAETATGAGCGQAPETWSDAGNKSAAEAETLADARCKPLPESRFGDGDAPAAEAETLADAGCGPAPESWSGDGDAPAAEAETLADAGCGPAPESWSDAGNVPAAAADATAVSGTPAPEGGAPEFLDPEAQAVDWLLAHPDFFARHPELLATLEIPHDCAPASSLIERQVQVLRRQLASERQRLTHLIARAREYEALAARLHALVLQLIASQDREQLLHVLRDGLRREFHAEAVALKLFRLDVDDGDRLTDPLTLAFRDFLDRARALCGPLTPDKAGALFGETGRGIQAAALIPIHAEGQSGILAIGSADAARFHPDLGTELLDRLGEVVSQKLRVMPLAARAEANDPGASGARPGSPDGG